MLFVQLLWAESCVFATTFPFSVPCAASVIHQMAYYDFSLVFVGSRNDTKNIISSNTPYYAHKIKYNILYK